MSKINLASVLEKLLKEGHEGASDELHKYFVETCAEINNSIIAEDDEDDITATEELPSGDDVVTDTTTDDSTDTDETPSTGGQYALNVYYQDLDGDCASDDAIMQLIGTDDMDGAGWAKGVRSLEFQFDSESDANAAAEALNNADEGALPTEISTSVDAIPFAGEDDDSEEPAEEGSDDVVVDTDESVEESDDDSSSEGGEESPISGEEEGSDEDEDVDPTSIFKDPEESDSDKIDDLASSVEELKAQIAALSDSDFDNLEESYTLEPVKDPGLSGKKETGSNGKAVNVNDESLIPGNKDMENRIAGEPIEIKSENHNGYEREAAPAVKTLNIGNNEKKGVMDGTSKVSKEGDKSALLNKTGDGFGSDSPGSIIDGK